MGMTYIVGKNYMNPAESLVLNVNSAADELIFNALSFCLKENYPGIFDKITEQVVFVRFDELTKEEFKTVCREVASLGEYKDLSESLRRGLVLWGDFIQPLVDLDSRNFD